VAQAVDFKRFLKIALVLGVLTCAVGFAQTVSSDTFLSKLVEAIPDVITDFTSIIYEALPFIVLGVVLAGLLEEFVPQQLILRMIPRRKTTMLLAIALGGVLGMIFPMCECGIIPVMRRLLRKGVPLSVCVCYMLAGPIINIVVILSTWAAFSGFSIAYGDDQKISGSLVFVTMRLSLGFLVAFVTSVIVEWQHRLHGKALLAATVVKDMAGLGDIDTDAAPRTWKSSLNNITETALHDFIDIMAFLVLGAILASLGRVIVPYFGVESVIKEYPMLAIPIMMGLAIIFCICSEADAFVAANMQPLGLWPLSSQLAFLVLGPMLDFKLYFMYTRVFRQRLIFTIILCLVVQVLVYNLLIYYLVESQLGAQRAMSR
jgi:uncharacterized membrane protein YraQ (UPF0718 family)